HATGGPNTAYVLGMLLANHGIPVSFISTDLPPDEELDAIKLHVQRLTGLEPDALEVEFLDGSNRSKSLALGYNDVLMATAWWTAHAAQSATSMLRCKRIYYLVQDYETLFYGASENFADADASYSFDHVPIINTSLLRDHLASHAVGRYASTDFSRQAIEFEPAIDQSYFHPEERDAQHLAACSSTQGPLLQGGISLDSVLLFCARPSKRGFSGTAVGNLLEWENRSIQSPLAAGYMLEPAKWLGFEGLATDARNDILLSSMLSPHPSYPPLEMAACGGLAVTTAFGSKTAARLAALSPNLIGAEPEIGDMLLALARAARAQRHAPPEHTAPTESSAELDRKPRACGGDNSHAVAT
ncbi:hypothetical protein BZM27_52780, partial [Paraburkholderia steynii]